MIIFLLAGLAAAVTLLPILTSCNNHTQDFVYHIYSMCFVLKGTYVLLSTVVCLLGLLKMNYWIKGGHIRLSETGQSLPICNDADDLQETAMNAQRHGAPETYRNAATICNNPDDLQVTPINTQH